MSDDAPLSALFLNCTLKRSPALSHTDGLFERLGAILAGQGVRIEEVRPVNHAIAFGVQPDMTEHGWDRDDWPWLSAKVRAADIVVVGSPIWIGEMSSVAVHLMERLYSELGTLNDRGQSIYTGQVGGVLVTGNEDGAKHVARNLVFSLQHMGFLIPPQVDAYWVGEAGPGPSYRDEGSGGPENAFTSQNVRVMAWSLLHAARMLRASGGFPEEGMRRD